MTKSIPDLIGKTPVVELKKICPENGARVFLKLEMFNPGGSVKDRIALSMIEEAEKNGELNQKSVVIEPTSGNTGIGLATVLSSRGQRLILTMPESMSAERRKLLKALGAELVLTPAEMGMKGAVEKARELKTKYSNSFIPGQFENPANPYIHEKTTGPEIWEQMEGKLDVFVAGIGTGGTISGAGRYLREKCPGLKVIGVEPEASPVLSGGDPSSHGIQGIGAGFIPEILDREIISEIYRVDEKAASERTRLLGKKEGILAGISTGAALTAALEQARNSEAGKRILAIAPDGGERYLSTDLFDREEGADEI